MEPSAGPPADGVGEVRRRAFTGVRVLMAVNLAAVPLSFVTNMVRGHASPVALGADGAVQIRLGTYYSLLVLGGTNVFTRFVPSLPEDRRLAFLASYGALMAGVLAGAVVLPALLLPGLTQRVLVALGGPSPTVALSILASDARVQGLAMPRSRSTS